MDDELRFLLMSEYLCFRYTRLVKEFLSRDTNETGCLLDTMRMFALVTDDDDDRHLRHDDASSRFFLVKVIVKEQNDAAEHGHQHEWSKSQEVGPGFLLPELPPGHRLLACSVVFCGTTTQIHWKLDEIIM